MLIERTGPRAGLPPALGRPAPARNNCGESVGNLARAEADCAIVIVSLPAFTQVRGLMAANQMEPVSGFEPLTVRLQGAILASLDVASHCLMCRLSALIVAQSRLASLRACLRWLPVWLP
jgi:hypothetical protein